MNNNRKNIESERGKENETERERRERSFLKIMNFVFLARMRLWSSLLRRQTIQSFFLKKNFLFLIKEKKFENFEARECCLKGKVVSG